MEQVFSENGLVAHWIGRLAMICRNRIEPKIEGMSWHPDLESEHWLGVLLPYFERRGKGFLGANGPGDTPVVDAKAFFNGLYVLQEDLEAAASSFDPVIKENMETFSRAMGLDQKEKTFLTFAVLTTGEFLFANFLGDIGEMSFSSALRCLARLFHWQVGDISQVLTSGRLVPGNIIKPHLWKKASVHIDDLFEINERFLDRFFVQHQDHWAFFAGYFNRVSSPAFPLKKFSHIPGVGLLTSYLEQAISERRPGVNILLYGPPGTGKTEFAKALALHLHANLFEVAFLRQGIEPLPPADRLSALSVAHQVLASSPEQSIILLDEAEDILTRQHFLGFFQEDSPTKIQVNRLLESNPVPVIWIVNVVHGIDPSHLRRFDLVVRVDSMPVEVRRQLIHDATQGLKVSGTWQQDLANEEIPPALITKAAHVVATVGSKDPEREMERLLSSSLQIIGKGGVSVRRARTRLPFRVDVLNTTPCIDEIFAIAGGNYPARLLFHGPSGTGKTELARHFAKRLGLPLLERRASDLFSSYVGETEQAIAAMFQEADIQDAVLLLDEVDSFLRTRREARNSWEITWVNEMLTGMERYDGWFICTTNLPDVLDEATSRRFDLRVEFRPMEPDQAWGLFTAIFRDRTHEEHRRHLFTLQLVPGNFATVYHRLSLLGAAQDPDRFLQELKQESVGHDSRPSIGFLR